MTKNVIKTSVQFKTWLAEHSFSQVISLLDMMGHALAQDAYGRPPDLLRNYVKPKGLNISKRAEYFKKKNVKNVQQYIVKKLLYLKSNKYLHN